MADALVWFRRDLRLDDNAALGRALAGAQRVFCAFVFDSEILDALESRADRRVDFIWQSVRELRETLRGQGGDLVVLHGRAREEVPRLAAALGVDEVVAAEDYEPAAVAATLADSETPQPASVRTQSNGSSLMVFSFPKAG